MFFTHNPKKTLIKELRNSEKLYEKLYKLSKGERTLKRRANKSFQDIEDFIKHVESLTAKEIKDLIDDA